MFTFLFLLLNFVILNLYFKIFRYEREHPDSKKDKDDFPEWFESDNQRELRQIFSVQSQAFDVLKDLHRKLDEVIGRQERTLSLISSQPVPVGKKI